MSLPGDTTSTDAEERARRAEAALEEALAERNRLWNELQRRTASEHEADYYRSIYAALEGSLSWRMTAPLRDAKRIARRALAVASRRLRARV